MRLVRGVFFLGGGGGRGGGFYTRFGQTLGFEHHSWRIFSPHQPFTPALLPILKESLASMGDFAKENVEL